MNHRNLIDDKSTLELYGLVGAQNVHWNLAPAELIEHAVRRGEGQLTRDGPFNAITRPHTGRSPRDKFLVREPGSEADVWWGKVNQPFEPEKFEALQRKVLDYLTPRELFVRDAYACADPDYRLRVRFITASAWHGLFVNNLLIRPPRAELDDFVPDFVIYHAPEMQADPAEDGTRTGAFVILNFAAKVGLIGGTRYAGELKKSVFTLLNYQLPGRGVLSMHCSANTGPAGDTALFFGLSGTGKTTLSADPHRQLIGDDEHGWSERGIFNLEGGCYAKVIRLRSDDEPEIYETTRRFGTVLENVAVDPLTRELDLDSEAITENTRAAYPLDFIHNTVASSMGDHPSHIVFLTADAFGVLPPISRLTPAQAMFHFLSGYTAKLAGTEHGVTTPEVTFSTCFGAPFMVRHPTVYANMLGERLARHGTSVWLVNTGWTGGPYGTGRRMRLAHTRAMVHAALDDALQEVPVTPDPTFGLAVPEACPGVPSEVLNPRNTWADRAAYDEKAHELAARFRENFEQFKGTVGPEVAAAMPGGG
jgi:phosphoenolpyruvate carboxykinase (ATP)